jgi:hypothetical protein
MDMKTNRTASLHLPQSVFASLAGSALLLMLAGCGGGPAKPDNMPDLTPCTVTVTYKGQPVQDATVTLAPKSGQFSAAGTTDARGKAVMKTNAMYDGVVPGEFLVSITKLEMVAAAGGGGSSDNPAEYAKSSQNAAASAPKSLIPQKFSSFRTSGLTLVVPQGTSVEKAFDLTEGSK